MRRSAGKQGFKSMARIWFSAYITLCILALATLDGLGVSALEDQFLHSNNTSASFQALSQDKFKFGRDKYLWLETTGSVNMSRDQFIALGEAATKISQRLGREKSGPKTAGVATIVERSSYRILLTFEGSGKDQWTLDNIKDDLRDSNHFFGSALVATVVAGSSKTHTRFSMWRLSERGDDKIANGLIVITR